DRTLEYERPDDIIVINSASEYYKLTGKKYKVPSGGSLKSSLPSSVDNSQSIYFPEVGDQGSVGACAAFAHAYYQFTHEMNKSQGIPTTPENTFSPKWAYNIQNGGVDSGSVSDYLYRSMSWQGVAQMPFAPYDNDYLSWIPKEEAWSNALKYKVKSYQYFDDVGLEESRITSADDSDLDAIKTALSNGEVLTYSTLVYSWKSAKLKTNPMAPENAKYAGQEVVVVQDGNEGAHRMALVGYNDNIWTDINNNDKVDAGEMGAFKIVNSWGESYCNGGFAWVAYDALNDEYSSVEGAPAYKNKGAIFEYVARIDVEPVKDNSDMYLKCTLNTSNRADVDVYLIAEKNGTVKTEPGFATTKHNIYAGEFAFDGTKNSSDGTVAFALNSVVPDISSENFHEYSWSVRFVDKANNGTILTVKDVAIVDVGENKVYTPQGFAPFTLDGSEKTVDITSATINDVVIYYVGYYNPTLHYKICNGQWQTVQMEKNSERYGYTHKFVIPSEDIVDVTLYFTDSDGDVDDNNGKYYKAVRQLNCYVTENQAKPLSASVKMDSVPDINKLMNFIATADGGYAPYRYEFIFTKLDDGTEKIRAYEHKDVAQWHIRYEGDYRITVNVKDQSNKVITASLDFYAENKHFEFASFTANPDKQIMTGDTIKFTAVSDFESIISRGTEYSMYDFVIKNTDTNEVVYTTTKRSDESHMSYRKSTNYLSWMPRKAGKYSITISSTDGSNDYAEKSLEFTVAEYNGSILGDADNSGKVNITDAILVMKYNIGGLDDSKLWLRLSDGNDDSKVDLRDAIYIMKFIVSDKNAANVGKVNYKELPTEPPTEAPTQKPTEKPTVPPTNPIPKNIVTFTNSYNWGGTMYCYYWSDTNKSMTAWPGKPMTKSGTNPQGQALYTYEVPGEATYVIFTNGSAQTVDIPYSGGEIRCYPTDTDSKGHYNVKTW
ncbi:MAG: starch-binding protein, partial [Acutalibacteraceae bacterium]|nr:starch-binding protein [Acutalibacteraceae bacterium]